MGDETPASNSGFYFDNNRLISLLLGILAFMLTGAIGVLYADVTSLTNSFNAHVVDAARQAQLYVRKDDLGEVNQRLQRIEDKLDEKADKVK